MGRRLLNSILSGIRPCVGPRVASAGDCCTACLAATGCVAWSFTKAFDCRSQGITDVASTGACYLIDSYTGSYDPLDALSFVYASGKV
jgi:hypothetical protein